MSLSSQTLTTILLNKPEEFLEQLRSPPKDNGDFESEIKEWLRDTRQKNTYYSPGLIQLFYLVGDLVNTGVAVFGYETSIPQELGIQILDALMEYQPDTSIQNYYSEDLRQLVYHEEPSYTQRRNNQDFVQALKGYLGP